MTESRPFTGTIIYVGHLKPGQTSLMRAEAMERLGINLVRFNARHFLDQRSFLERRLNDTLERGPALVRLNRELVKVAERVKPAVVWFDKQEYVAGETVERLKALGAFLVFYTPDPYFQHSWHQTRTMTANFPTIDLFVTTKTYELDAYRKYGEVYYMPHGYCETVHRPLHVPEAEKIDFGFIGSWEPRRESFMERVGQNGLSVKIWGLGWDHLQSGTASFRTRMRLKRMANGEPFNVKRSTILADHIEPGEIYADAYCRALSASRISPGLLRTTLYPDQHTTRTFEIPASGSMLLAERTPEHEAFFEEDKEAVFFVGEEELVEKATWYAKNHGERRRVTEAGRRRCLESGYSYRERLRGAMEEIARMTGDRARNTST